MAVAYSGLISEG